LALKRLNCYISSEAGPFVGSKCLSVGFAMAANGCHCK